MTTSAEPKFFWVHYDKREPMPFGARVHYLLEDPDLVQITPYHCDPCGTRVIAYCKDARCAAASADLARIWALEHLEDLNTLEERYQLNFPAETYLQLDAWRQAQRCTSVEELKELFSSWGEYELDTLYAATEGVPRAPVLRLPARGRRAVSPPNPETPPSHAVSPVPSRGDASAELSLSAAVARALPEEEAHQVPAPENLPAPSPHAPLPPPAGFETVFEQFEEQSEAADGLVSLQTAQLTPNTMHLGDLDIGDVHARLLLFSPDVNGNGAAGPSQAPPPAGLPVGSPQVKKILARISKDLFDKRRRDHANKKRKVAKPSSCANFSQQAPPKRANTQQDLPTEDLLTEAPVKEDMPDYHQETEIVIIEDSQPPSPVAMQPLAVNPQTAGLAPAPLDAAAAGPSSPPTFHQLSAMLGNVAVVMQEKMIEKELIKEQLMETISEKDKALKEKDLALEKKDKTLEKMQLAMDDVGARYEAAEKASAAKDTELEKVLRDNAALKESAKKNHRLIREMKQELEATKTAEKVAIARVAEVEGELAEKESKLAAIKYMSGN